MAELTAAEKLERARQSILVAEERLHEITKILPGLDTELNELLVRNEIQGYKGRTIEKKEAEIESLQKEKNNLERTITALQGRIPELEKDWMLERTATETVGAYEAALGELTELLRSVPSSEKISAALRELQGFTERVGAIQEKLYTASQRLNETLIKEGLPSIGPIDIDTLKTNSEGLDYQGVFELSESLLELNEDINAEQYQLFMLANNSLRVIDPPPPDVNEVCECRNHKREHRAGSGWQVWEHQQDPKFYNVKEWVLIRREGAFKDKPEFSCEIEKILRQKETEKRMRERENQDEEKLPSPGKMVFE
jgi:hypothetical protein